MYPQTDLSLLAMRKRALMHRIRVRREECAGHAHEVLKPAVWAEGLYAKWCALSPFVKLAGIPLGMMVTRKFMPKVGGLLRWASMAVNIFRAFR